MPSVFRRSLRAATKTERHLGFRCDLASVALAALSGVLLLAASPPYDLWPLAFVSWAPLVVATRGRSPREALLLGAAQGLAWNVGGNGWLPSVIRTFGELPWVACGLIA